MWQRINLVGVALLAAFIVGCGSNGASSSNSNTNTTSPGSGSTLPSMAGPWHGAMAFGGVSGGSSFTLNINQDASGNLSGNITAVPPICQFSDSITGQIFANGQLAFQTTGSVAQASFSGTMTGTGVGRSISGNAQLGQGTGCSASPTQPRIGTFSGQPN
ncbi:MAG: hypothetical protein ACJ71Q_09030 [Terriglobales bacterium]